ncbi:MAG: WecB/TagA/CpsF family glycosyltransferase [Candidatus Kerfeldbacteria bacterium]|nr:WecB/TagA/CpsF family glycosyltransferase [Candidatus Kerfeldbacteria bacterium]
MSRTRLKLLDIPIDNLTPTEAQETVHGFLRQGGFHHVVTPGAEFLLEATANPQFRKILQQADLSLADGMSVHLASLLNGEKLKSRIPGADFVAGLMDLAEAENYSVFLFGAKHGVAERAAERLIQQHPRLRIVGFDTDTRGSWFKIRDQRMIEKIHLAKPDILLVALGAPKQELWIAKHRPALHDVKVAIGVGRSLDYISGVVTRPPKVFRVLGLEWLHTFWRPHAYHQPDRRRQRVVNATWRFMWAILRKPHD